LTRYVIIEGVKQITLDYGSRVPTIWNIEFTPLIAGWLISWPTLHQLWGVFLCPRRDSSMKSKKIIVNRSEVVCFDDGSIEKWNSRLSRFTKSFGCNNGDGYKGTNISKKKFPVHRLIAMAFLCDYSAQMQVDHIDGDRSNNRVDNLRMVTPSQNKKAYMMPRDGTTSRFRGVCWDRSRGLWMASVYSNGSKKNLGRFNNEEDAAISWNRGALLAGYSQEALNQI